MCTTVRELKSPLRPQLPSKGGGYRGNLGSPIEKRIFWLHHNLTKYQNIKNSRPSIIEYLSTNHYNKTLS